MMLRWRDGVFVLDIATNADQMQANVAAERVFLEILATFERAGRDVSDKTSSAYAPTLFEEAARAKGVSKKRLVAAMERLFSSDQIHIEVKGPPSKPRRRILSGPLPSAANETETDQ